MDEKRANTAHFTVVPRRTPLPSQIAVGKTQQNARQHEEINEYPTALAPAQNGASDSSALARAGFRSENEDDDGYDPYSDFHDAPECRPLFEQDPWN